MNAALGLAGRRHGRLVDRRHRPVALAARPAACASLKWSSAQKIGSQRCASGDARLARVRRVDDQHGVKLEADLRPRLHVAHAGQQQRGQHVAIAQARVNPGGHFLQQLLARRVFQQPHDRLDLGLEPHDVRRALGLGGRDRPQVARKARSPSPAAAPAAAAFCKNRRRELPANMAPPSLLDRLKVQESHWRPLYRSRSADASRVSLRRGPTTVESISSVKPCNARNDRPAQFHDPKMLDDDRAARE